MSISYDLSYLREVSKGNTAFMLDMIQIFLTKTPETLDLLESFIRESNWEMVGFYAHKLKATYAYMGMLALKELLINIEKSAKNTVDLELIPIWFNELKQHTLPALIEIEKIKSTL